MKKQNTVASAAQSTPVGSAPVENAGEVRDKSIDERIRGLRRAVEQNPWVHEDWYELAECLFETYETEKAKKAVLKALETDPHCARSRQLLGEILIEELLGPTY